VLLIRNCNVRLLIQTPRPSYSVRVASLPDHLLPAPVGKERLSKEVVAEHQRGRVLMAATAAFAARGYRATTVDDIVSAARIGVGSFYAHFSGKQDCLLRLYDEIVADGRERIGAATAAEASWAGTVLVGLRTILELAASEPDRARIAVVEARTAGPAGEARYAQTVAQLGEVLRQGRSTGAPGGEAPPESFEEAAVSGLAWILHRRLAAGEPVVVDELLPEVADFLVGPYVDGVREAGT
jgi:AcrR family transcriptional regulator